MARGGTKGCAHTSPKRLSCLSCFLLSLLLYKATRGCTIPTLIVVDKARATNDDPTRRRGVVGVIREKCRGEQPCTIYDVNDVEHDNR